MAGRKVLIADTLTVVVVRLSRIAEQVLNNAQGYLWDPDFDRDALNSGTATPKKEPTMDKALTDLVIHLESRHGLWVNGLFPDIDLPATASLD